PRRLGVTTPKPAKSADRHRVLVGGAAAGCAELRLTVRNGQRPIRFRSVAAVSVIARMIVVIMMMVVWIGITIVIGAIIIWMVTVVAIWLVVVGVGVITVAVAIGWPAEREAEAHIGGGGVDGRA